MRPHIQAEISAGTLAAMTAKQFKSLQDNVLNEGSWETADGLKVVGSDDHVGVLPMKDGGSLIYIGIEKDGYTHS